MHTQTIEIKQQQLIYVRTFGCWSPSRGEQQR